MALLVALEFALPALGIRSYVMPVPSAVIGFLGSQLVQPSYWEHVSTTLVEIFGGLLVGAASGFLLGLLFTQSRALEAIMTPYVVALQAVPKIALAPVIVLTLGFGLSSKIAIAAIVAFFPMLINVMVGIKSADRQRLDMMRQLRATRYQTLRWVTLPGALLSIMGGLRIATSFAVLGAIVGEFTGSAKGLGRLLLEYNFNFDQAGVFAVLIALSLIAIALDLLIQVLSRRLVFWETPHKEGVS